MVTELLQTLPAWAYVLLVVGVFIILGQQVVIWRMIEKDRENSHAVITQVANMIPIDALKSMQEAAYEQFKQLTERTPNRYDDYAPELFKRMADFGISSIEKRQKSAQEIVLEIPEEGLG